MLQESSYYVIKTDNDLRKAPKHSDFSTIGFSRINGILKNNLLPTDRISGGEINDKIKLYDDNKTILDSIRKDYHVYLSKVSLEEDLDEVIHDEMVSYLLDSEGDPVGYLKDAKKYHMVELVEKLTDEDCKKIIGHYNFECLEDILG